MPVWEKYPWLCGYAGASLFLEYASRLEPSPSFPWTPFLTLPGKTISSGSYRDILKLCYSIHFIRRTLEVLFIQTYTGGTPIKRESVSEFIYYAVMGFLNGYSLSRSITHSKKVKLSSKMQFYIGILLFAIGQVGNCYCHFSLEQQKQANSPKRFIPKGLFFDSVIAPHYSFEIITWVGYTLASGANLGSLLLLAATLGVLPKWSKVKKEALLKLAESASEKGMIAKKALLFPRIL